MLYTPEQVSEAMEHLPTLWIHKYQIKNEAGIPIEFKQHRFQYEPYNDLSPLQVGLKPPQIGDTVKDIIKSFWVAAKLKKDIIYTLPTQSDVNDMAGGKINRIVAQNPILQQWVKNHDSVEQKSVGDNIIYYRGTFSNKQAMMVSSDLNIHDEVDASDASVITQYETRLQAKADGWRWYFSHPSLAGYGVDIPWQQSDKKEWMVKCRACALWQVLSWPGNVNRERRTYCCSRCGADMDDATRIAGIWVNRLGDKWTGKVTSGDKFSGWHKSQLMCPWISASAILDARDDPMKDEQYFWNYVLGLPYIGSENKIMPDVVLKNATPQVNDQSGSVIIGVDTGLPWHIVCMNKDGAFYNETFKNPGDEGVPASYSPALQLEKLMLKWPKSIVIADQGGDLTPMRILQAKYPGRVFLCWYRKDRKGQEVIRWGKDKEAGAVVVDRNNMIQLIVEQLRDAGRIRLNGSSEDWNKLAEHFGNIYRIAKETPFGVEHAWERNGPDHFVHALLYAMVGLDRFSEQEAKIIGSDPMSELEIARIFS